jgi:hypothetical protein
MVPPVPTRTHPCITGARAPGHPFLSILCLEKTLRNRLDGQDLKFMPWIGAWGVH